MTDLTTGHGPDPAQPGCRSCHPHRRARARSVPRSRVASVAAFVAALVVLLLPPPAWAQTSVQDADLPGRVGRVADLAGDLFLSARERATDWTGIGLNTTITTGDNLWVSAEGRSEIDYGGGQVRLAGDTNIHVARLDDTQLALFLAQGHLIVRVRILDGGEAARVDTPNAQIQLLRPGLYRIDVSPDRQATQLVVREGEANVWLPSGSQQVLPGQTATVTGGESATGDVRNGAAQDTFDAWSASRDRHYERGRSAAYVSRQMVGWADLDDNGVWNTDATYGAVWFPTTVADDWAPYRYGSWSWLPGWGWTWVDDAPWGYAPFHYGRWAFVGSRWGWIPGGYIARPVWAPALVGWYGGAGWSVSVGVGAPVFGWVPLGWGDPYLPSWNNCSRRCWTLYNRPYAVNHAERPHAPPTRYANYGVPGAITAVGGATLVGRKPVAANRVPLPRDPASAPPVLAAAPAVKPHMVPGARPASATPAPLPAERFIREKPALGAGPGGRSAVAPAVPSGAAGAGRAGGSAPPAGVGGTAGASAPGAFAPAPQARPAAVPPSEARPSVPPGSAAPPAAGRGASPSLIPTPTPTQRAAPPAAAIAPAAPAAPAPTGRAAGTPPAAAGGAAVAPAWRATPPARYDPQPAPRAPSGAVAAPASPPLATGPGGSAQPAPRAPVQRMERGAGAPQGAPAALPAAPRHVAPAVAPRPAAPPAAVPVVPHAVPQGAVPQVAPAVPPAGGDRGGKPAPKQDGIAPDRPGTR
jgi:hypothetical protein